VALNKRKVLDAAQKYLQKGNLDKALKEYQKVVDADPKDANVRLKVGDVQLRKGNSAAAIEAYLDVANRFMRNGFDAKAVALLKQITKIDEKRYDIYEPLAELYQRLGLTSDAMSALQIAADAHQREGRKKEGLALLRKMASLDPSNTKTRLKIAEMLWKEGLQEESLAEYDEVVAEYGRQGDHEGMVRVHEQVLRSLPERAENLIGLGAAQLELGRPQQAEAPLLKATEVAVDSIEAWESLARVHEAMGRRKDFEDAWKTVAAIHKDRGNDERAKEILQLYVTLQGLDEEGAHEYDEETGGVTLGDLGADPAEELDIGSEASAPPEPAEAPAPPAAESAEPAAPEPVEEEPPEIDLDDEIEIELDDEVSDAAAEAESEPAADAAPAGASADASADASAEADPAQLLAEAGVYLRYSQHDKAVQCLELVLESAPGHVKALEKLGETRLALGDAEAAVALWREAAEYARSGGDDEAFDQLCDRIRGVDEAAAESLAGDALAPTPESDDNLDPDLDFELEFDTPSGEPELTGEVSSLELEIDLDDAPPEPLAEPEPESAAEAADAEEETDLSGRFGEPAGVRLAGAESAEVPAEDLEEAEFYFRQGLLDEAEQILKRLLERAPGHPQVLLRLGEIAKSRGDSPCEAVGEKLDFDETADDTQPGAARDAESDSTVEDLEGAPLDGGPKAGPDDVTMQADPDDFEDVDVGFDPDDDDDATLGSETVPTLGAASPAAEEDAGGFDLAAELQDELDDSRSGAVSGEDSIGGTTQAGFQSIFQSFKAGVKETLGEGEYETHYDLGIAYHEMGLLEDAIGEFAAAMPSPTRKLDCLAMMGACAIDLGRAADAVAHLEQALALPDLGEERMASLRFDLGRAFALQSDWNRTRELWEQVRAFDPDFQEVSRRLEELGDDSAPSLGVLDPVEAPSSGEALESFDDLIAEAEDDDGSDDDDPDDDPGGSDPDDSSSDMGSTQWGRKISYG